MAQLRAQDALSATGLAARSTTGQSLAIRYDARSNTLTFVEDGWFAAGFRSGVGRGEVRLRLGAAVSKFKPRSRS